MLLTVMGMQKIAWVMAVALVAKVALFGAVGSPPETKQWPQHRGGPDLRGLAAGKLGSKLKLIWTFETGDFLKSSAVVKDGRVFIGADTGKGLLKGLIFLCHCGHV